MEIRIFDNIDALQNAAAWIFLHEALSPCARVIGLSTGTTTTPVHAKIVEAWQRMPFDTGAIHTANIDDYVGIPAGHPASCATRIRGQLLDPLGIDAQHGLLPESDGENPQRDAEQYEARIRALGGIGLQLLGLGTDAHIGFCRPGTPFASLAHAVPIPGDTRAMLHARYGLPEAQLPAVGITLGIRSVMQAQRIVVLAHGADKAKAVADAIGGPVTEAVPASVLQLHAKVTWLLDGAAARLL